MPSPDANNKPRSHFGLIMFIAAITLVALAAWGIISRVSHTHKLKKQTQQSALRSVNVIHPEALTNGSDIILPGSLVAWHEASLSARVSGYLKAWHKDIGDKVEAGDLLADIDTPETDRQLQQAEADLKLAIANSELAQVTAQRWLALVGTNAVSKQETDEKVAAAKTAAATVVSQTANRNRLRELETFKRIVAPFGGVVTARTTDVGVLINAGSGELFHVSTIDRLRVYISVPEIYTASLSPEVVADLHFTEHPGQTFQARLLNTSRSIDPSNRTILAQFVLDNLQGTIFPGGFAEVHLKSPQGQPTLRLPVNAFLFQDNGLQIAVVDSDQKIALKTVTPGRDFGKSLEVIAGLSPQDNVIINPPDSLYQGESVRIAPPPKQNGGQPEEKNKKNNPPAKITEDGQGLQDENSSVPESSIEPSGGDNTNKKDNKKKPKNDDPNTRDDAQ